METHIGIGSVDVGCEGLTAGARGPALRSGSLKLRVKAYWSGVMISSVSFRMLLQ